jgi:uncharacterized integral membrane protein (TIGR00698 family)
VPQYQGFSVAARRLATGCDHIVKLLPGVIVCAAVAAASSALEGLERRLFPHPYVEALVVAILLGMAVRMLWKPSERWQTGIAFSAKQLLEVAVVLLGASTSFAAIAASGVVLLGAVAATVVVTLGLSFGVSRMLGLPIRLSILIACGNSICGNSAIAALAPVIGADGDDIACSISFTALLGVVMVLGLPLLVPLLQLSAAQYAVPQVLAATVPAGLVSTQIGTLVKLMRVLMLGPIAVALSLSASRLLGVRSKASVGFFRLVPWFIIGFLALAALRSLDVVPATAVGQLTGVTGFLTIVSMAALGLGVDVRVLAGVGGKVTAAVTLSLLLLLAMSIGLTQLFK